jgi:hypothetical protein
MMIFYDFPVPRSLAETDRIPLASISNVVSNYGSPYGAGGIYVNSN